MLEDSNDPLKTRSRKYRISLLSLFLISSGFLFTELLNLPHIAYIEYVAGVLGVLTLYLGGNVSNKYVLTKTNNPEATKDESN